MSFPRYEKYKDSGVEWLGEVPAHWAISRLGYESWVRARLGWKGLKAEEYVDDGFVLLATPNIKGKDIDFENVNYINEFRYEESPEIKLRAGDVLLAKDGSTLGTVNVVREIPRHGTVNSSIAVITPGVALRGLFLYYLLQSTYMANTIQRIKGGMGVPHLFQWDLNKFYLPLPPLPEQGDIATFLDHETAKIDALVEEQKRLIELLKEKRQAVISHAVTKGLNPNAPMKDSRAGWIGQVPQHWRVSSLGYVARIDSGSTPDRANPDYWGGSIPWVKTGEVNYDSITQAEECITEAGLQGSSAKVALPGTLLMAMYGQGVTRGRVALLDVPAAYNQACAAINFGLAVTPSFGRYFFMAAYEHVRDGGNETSQMNLSTGVIQKFKITVPPPPEQFAIVEFLDRSIREIEVLIEHAGQSLILLSERRTALISVAVTGKIDVRAKVKQSEPALA